MSVDTSTLNKEFDKVTDSFKSYLKNLRTGRANPAMFEGVEVEYYGQMVDLKSLANIIIKTSLSVVIEPYNKNDADSIAEAIQKANMGFNPINEGQQIRIEIPPMTEEKRKKIVADMSLELENTYKKRVRQLRQDFIHKSERQEGISEDEVAGDKKKIQQVVDSTNKELDKLAANKEKEVMDIAKN